VGETLAAARLRIKGYWKLRVGDYRVVFEIVKNEVWIFASIGEMFTGELKLDIHSVS
jgi:hypothetical protein